MDILAGSSTTPIIEIWNADGTTLLAESESPIGVFESPAENTVSELGYLQWNTGGAGTFMVRIRDATSDVIPAGQDYLVHFALTGQTVNATAPAGADTIDGGDGDDRLYGGADDDSINGGLGNDDIFGGSGNDLAFGGTGKDTVVGDAGLDLLYGGDGDDFVMAGDGAFAVLGDIFADTLYGGAGRDSVWSDGGGDFLYGGIGNDYLGVAIDDASPVTGFLYGGDGRDQATFYPFGSFQMDLRQVELSGIEEIGFAANISQPSAHMTAAQFAGIERLSIYGNATDLLGIDIDMGSETALDLSALGFASLGPDDFANVFTIHGDDDAETIHGSSLPDVLFGGGGVDLLYAGSGNDTLEGGIGVDTLFGGIGDDTFHGSQGTDRMYGGSGNDTFDLTEGLGRVYGGDGFDVLRFVGRSQPIAAAHLPRSTAT